MESVGRRMIAAYASASIDLYSRLWLHLEELSIWLAETDGDQSADIELQIEILRLELVVLLDACDSSRWQSLLRPEHRRSLRKTIHDLLSTLAVPTDALGPRVILEAQNQLFDCVVNQYSAQYSARFSPAFSQVIECVPA